MSYIIDRFEGDNTVCEKEDRTTLLVPRSELPPQSMEGDVLVYEDGVYRIDSDATQERRRRIEEKRKRQVSRKRISVFFAFSIYFIKP